MSIVFHPHKPSWGEDIRRYTTTPSYLVPPVFLASLIVDAVVREWVPENQKTYTWEDGLKEVVLK